MPWRRILSLITHNAKKTYGRVEVQLHAFLNLALDGSEWSASCSYRFTPERWMRHGLSKRRYLTTSLHGIIVTQKAATWISIQAPFTSPWRWRQRSPPKLCYPTTTLHGVTTQKTTTWISIQAPLTSPWRWRQQGPSKRWYPTTSLHGVITQKTMTWNFTAMKI
jgi:hypothetical protein